MMSRYPRPVREVHQIELTTRCNLRCHYCPQFPKLPRAREDMTWKMFEQAMNLVAHYVSYGTQTELSLTGIGESMLHPRFLDMVCFARQVIGDNRPLVVTTNGLLLDDAMAASLALYNVRVFVSLHRPEKAGLAVEVAKRHGILAGTNSAFATSAFNWAGTQKWFVSAPRIPCEYLRSGWCVVLVDGWITTCCMDPDGRGVFGHVQDDPRTLQFGPHGLCQTCHMDVP